MNSQERLAEARRLYPEKFAPMEAVFSHIRRGARIFVGTGCGEPQYLVRSLTAFAEASPKAIFDAEIIHVWTLGVSPYTEPRFKGNFRHNSFFIGNSTRAAVNDASADYTPVFLSRLPDIFARGLAPIDVALIQTSSLDDHGCLSLGISVDVAKAAIESATLVVAQVNSNMPRVHGDGFINIKDVDFVVPFDEPLLEYLDSAPDEIAKSIGKYVARLIPDGSTIQVGYGNIPNAILSGLTGKKHLGVHTELLSDGIIDLLKQGVIDNSMKTLNRGKTVATFCMGKRSTYEYLNDNPAIEFKTIDWTNNPLVIAQQERMVAINSALEIDLTGQATAESLGKLFYSGIGGQADFMRGTILARGGRTILALQSTAVDGAVSRIVPFLKEGAGVTLSRGDIHYVVTEYGIAFLHGKNVRQRAMELISIAHPRFRAPLLEQARSLGLVYKDQAFIEGDGGIYPESLETYRTTTGGIEVLLRPVKMADEPLLKDFFYALSDTSMYRRFFSTRKDMPHERLQEMTVIDYTAGVEILAVLPSVEKELLVGIGRYYVDEARHIAEVAFVVRDDYQGKGIGAELLSYLTFLARTRGLLGFTAEVLVENKPMLHLLAKMGFEMKREFSEGVYELRMGFDRRPPTP